MKRALLAAIETHTGWGSGAASGPMVGSRGESPGEILSLNAGDEDCFKG